MEGRWDFELRGDTILVVIVAAALIGTQPPLGGLVEVGPDGLCGNREPAKDPCFPVAYFFTFFLLFLGFQLRRQLNEPRTTENSTTEPFGSTQVASRV